MMSYFHMMGDHSKAEINAFQHQIVFTCSENFLNNPAKQTLGNLNGSFSDP